MEYPSNRTGRLRLGGNQQRVPLSDEKAGKQIVIFLADKGRVVLAQHVGRCLRARNGDAVRGRWKT